MVDSKENDKFDLGVKGLRTNVLRKNKHNHTCILIFGSMR